MEVESIEVRKSLETPQEVAEFLRTKKVTSLLLIATTEEDAGRPSLIAVNATQDFMMKATYSFEAWVANVVAPAFGVGPSTVPPLNRAERRRRARGLS